MRMMMKKMTLSSKMLKSLAKLSFQLKKSRYEVLILTAKNCFNAIINLLIMINL